MSDERRVPTDDELARMTDAQLRAALLRLNPEHRYGEAPRSVLLAAVTGYRHHPRRHTHG